MRFKFWTAFLIAGTYGYIIGTFIPNTWVAFGLSFAGSLAIAVIYYRQEEHVIKS